MGGCLSCQNGERHGAYQKEPETKGHSRKKRLGTRERDRRYRKHLRKLAALNENDCLKKPMHGGALYMDETAYGPVKKPYYRRYWRASHNNRFKYWRGIAGRKMRRYKGDAHNGGFYKKVFDYRGAVD